MNLPIQTNLSSNQVRNRILGYTNKLSDEQNQWIDAIKESFYTNLDYFSITKNLLSSPTYDVWIFDGNKDEKVFGNKQFLSYPYDTPQFQIGDYITFKYGAEYENWLITSLDITQNYNVNGIVEWCLTNLIWNDKSGVFHSIPCIIKDLADKIIPDFNKLIITQKGYIKITVQQNDITNLITENYRFLFGIPNNYTAFKVIFVNNFTKTKTITFDLEADAISPNDDIINGIAANDSAILPPTPSPTGITNLINPNVSTILQGIDNIESFTVFAYSNSVVQTDTFSIVASGVPNDYFVLNVVDGNHFTVTNNHGVYNDSKLKIVCTNNVDATTVEMDVLLGGEW